MRKAVITMATLDYLHGAQNLFKSLEATTDIQDIDFICLTNESLTKSFFGEKEVSLVPLDSFPDTIRTSEKISRFRLTLKKFQIFSILEYGDYDRVVFLDADMVALCDVSKLFEEDLNEFDFCAVRDLACGIYYSQSLDEIGLNPDQIFNTGCVVLNRSILNRLKYKELVDFTIDSGKSYDGSDQGYLNYAIQKFGVPWGELPLKFNCVTDSSYPLLWRYPLLLHFTGEKPWKPLDLVPKHDKVLYEYYRTGRFIEIRKEFDPVVLFDLKKSARLNYTWVLRNFRVLLFRFTEKYHRGLSARREKLGRIRQRYF